MLVMLSRAYTPCIYLNRPVEWGLQELHRSNTDSAIAGVLPPCMFYLIRQKMHSVRCEYFISMIQSSL